MDSEANKQTGAEYLDSLKRQIDSMAPIEKACSMTMLQLGRLVCELLNVHHWEAIDSMREVCGEIFGQAEQIKNEKRVVN